MKHKRLYILGFSSLTLISLFLPASVALAAKLSSHGAATQLAAQAGFPGKYFAPYVEANQANQIGQAEQQAGVKYFILAFILGQGCKAVWGGGAVLSPSPDPIMTEISKIRNMGGDVSISFGGAKPPELALVCPDAASLQKQYQTVIDTYHVTHLDFDIEGAAIADANVDKRNQALAALQKANPGLAISYTLSVSPNGLSSDGMNLLKDAVKNGVKIDFVNIMTMDYFGGATSKEEGDNAISAAKATEKQLSSLGLLPRIGVIPMIGRNDDPAEVFTLDDARKLVAFAQQDPNVVELSMWALQRDRSCGGQFNELSDCSFQTQQQYDFSKAFNAFLAGPPPPALGPPPPALGPPPPSWAFPCSDVPGPTGRLQPSEKAISQDWLSGDVPVVRAEKAHINGQGRLAYTYTNDTEGLPQVRALFGVMEGLAFLLIAPSVILLGYQLMVGASTFRYAGALEGLSHVALGALGVGVSFQLVHTLVAFENYLTAGIVALHGEYSFPRITINRIPIPYSLAGEPAMSYRGIVMPMSRWGCALNDFMGIFSRPFVTSTLGSIVPVIGGIAPFAGHVTNMFDLIRRCGEMVVAVLSFLLWVQVFFRIVLLNYYLLMGPLAFACWALPGGVGQRVVRLWCKGFFTVLFLQAVQLFMLTTLPLLLPPMPQAVVDGLGIMQALLLLFPLILTLLVTILVPRVLGTSAAEAFGTAGSMAGGVVVAVGNATSQMR